MTAANALQWGRDLAIAEILNTGTKALQEAELQWGRDLAIAEMRADMCFR